jgi:NitT/TauT family transport system permease protein
MELEALDIEVVEARVQQALRKRDLRARVSGIVYPVVTVVLILIVWEVAVRLLRVPEFLVPTPTKVVAKTLEHLGLLIRHGWVTTKEILLGYLLSIVVGIPLALAIFLWPAFARSVYPLLVASQAVPKTAIAPLFVIWFGFGLVPKVLIAFLIAFFAIVINTVVGLESVQPEKIYLARSMGLSPLATFLKIRLPQALPAIFGGLKVAITLAVVGAVVGEFVGSDSGLGYLLLQATGSLDSPLLFAGFVPLTLIGAGLFLLIELIEWLAIPWHTSQRRAEARESL